MTMRQERRSVTTLVVHRPVRAAPLLVLKKNVFFSTASLNFVALMGELAVRSLTASLNARARPRAPCVRCKVHSNRGGPLRSRRHAH